MRTRTLLYVLSLLALSGCGDDLARVTAGDIGEISDVRFGQTLLGRESNQQFRIENNGDGDLEIRNIEIRDASPFLRFQDGFVADMRLQHDWVANSGHQTFSDHPAFNLEPSREIQVDVVFAPDSTDLACPSGNPSESCGTIVITTNDRDTPVLEVNISLSQSSGRISVDPTVLEFPRVDAIVGPQERTFEITNVGAGLLTGITVTDPAVPGIQLQEEDNRPEPFDLEVGETALYHVTFTPIADHEYCAPGTEDSCTLGQIVVDSDDVEGAQTIVTLLAGGGSVPDLEVSATELVFDAAVGDPDTQTLDVSNVGGANLNWNLRVDPAAVRDLFALEVNGTAYAPSGAQIPALASGNTATVELTLSPADENPVRGELVITAINDPDEGVTRIQLYGGPAAPELLVEPTQLYFHNIAPEESTELQLLLRNTGRASLNITEAVLAGSTEFAVDPIPVGAIPAGGVLPLTVTYTRPDGDLGGLDNGTYTITSNALAPNDSYTINFFAYHSVNALPPTAVIEVDPAEPYAVDQTVTLDASGSTPPEAGSLPENPYHWAIIGRPATSSATLSSNFEETITFVPDVVGTYTVLLTVTATIDGTNPVERTQGQVTRNLLVQ